MTLQAVFSVTPFLGAIRNVDVAKNLAYYVTLNRVGYLALVKIVRAVACDLGGGG